jgi:hypothetical protein
VAASHHRKDLVGGGRRFTGRGGPIRSPNTPQRRLDDFRVCGRLVAGELVSVANGGQPAPDGRCLDPTINLGGEEGGYRFRGGGKGRDALRLAPTAEQGII